MDKYYIDLSTQNSSDLLKNNNNNLLNYNNNNNNNNNNSNLNNNGDLIEGFGNFGRVNLEKCCPLEYMWSENQKKCVKICDGCAIGAYGNINYEFLHNHGDEFMSFAQCVGDATEAYDFDKINKRYGIDELLTQYDLNFHIDSDPNASGVQPAEENPWESVTGGMYQTSSKQEQMNIRKNNTWNQFLDCNGSGVCEQREGTFRRVSDNSGNNSQDSSNNSEEIIQNRINICSTNYEISESLNNNNLCNNGEPLEDEWTSLCGLDDFNNLDFGDICNNEELNSLCNDGILNKDTICPDNR